MTEAPLDAWIERQLDVSAGRLLAAVSAVGLSRPGPRLGETMVPARGSVLAAPQPVPGPDEPDYFFHWLRDSAIVVRALLALYRQGRLPADAHGLFADWVGFERRTGRNDGALLAGAWPPAMLDRLRPYLRPRDEVARVRGTAVPADVRFNPDGSLDLLRWNRPQHDGPALRALTVLAILEDGPLGGRDRRRAEALLRADLRFCVRRHARPCYDPWEEEAGHHFFTRLVLRAALARGAAWAESEDDPVLARRLSDAAEASAAGLAAHWSPDDGFYRSRLPGPGITAAKALDSSVLVAVLHAGTPPFDPADAKIAATVDRLEAFFATYLPLNAGRAPAAGVALGRYAEDAYLGGGVFLPCALALAEFHYQRALGLDRDAAADARARGDAVLGFLRRFLPESGRLPEQLDRTTGAPASATDLAWSHAAFVTAAEARGSMRRAVA